MAQHRDVLRKRANELLSKPGVYAVGLGEKVSKGKRTGKRALVCSIAKKKPLAQLAQNELIADDYDGIPTDIVEIGSRPVAFPAYRDKQRPVMPGISVGHYAITAGTIGAIVEVDGDVMLLSNNHVFADENDAGLGDAIIQPGKYDGGDDGDRIGTLYNYVPLTFTDQSEPTPGPGPAPDPEPPTPDPDPEPEPEPEPPVDDDSDCKVANIFATVLNKIASIFGRETQLKPVRPRPPNPTLPPMKLDLVVPQIIMNRVDGAVARIDADVSYAINYLTFMPKVTGVNELAAVGTVVQKLGRTTGYTQGTIEQTDVIVDVGYDGGTVRFEDQIMIGANGEGASFSAGGDSGSLIMDEDFKAVALLFAGNDVKTFANPISDVMQELNITKFIGE